MAISPPPAGPREQLRGCEKRRRPASPSAVGPWSDFSLRHSRRRPSTTFSTTVSRLVRWAQHDLDSASPLLTINLVMTVFFFAIGLELFSRGPSRAPAKSTNCHHADLWPRPAACGRAAVRALWGATAHRHDIVSGWGVPMATDIAFSLAASRCADSRGAWRTHLSSHARHCR
jgi:hypothetical protein